ncbi:MAG: molybdenum ABC transporter ATP-binding protein [Xanthobacteraceae bacterium]
MALAVDVTHRLGSFVLEAHFTSEGKLTAFFGPSGSGKTSLLNIIAGIVRPDRGSIVLNDRTLVDTKRGKFVPKHRRRVGYVFQEARLFPHLTVRQNLLYGRWFTPRQERKIDLDQVLDLLNIRNLLDRRPGALSGGEKQRVAIGRALLTSPHLLLMDEPLASLDELLKEEILPFIERLRDEAQVPIVYVSHSLPEVARLATTVVLIKDGHVVGVGPPTEVLGRRDLLAAGVAAETGTLIEAVVSEHDDAFGLTVIRCNAGTLYAPQLSVPVGAPIRLRIRARDVMIATSRPDTLSALNVLPGRVIGVERIGEGLAEITLDCSGVRLAARLTLKSIDILSLVPGRGVYAVIKAVSLDRDTLSRAPMAEIMNADSTIV